MSRRSRAELALAGVTIVWGATFVVIKDALADVSAWLFLTLRFWVAAVALILIYRSAVRRQGIRPGLILGALLFAAYVLQTRGLELTTPSKSAFLTGLSIPLVPLIGSVVYQIRPRGIEIAGVLVGFAGMVLMTLSSPSDFTIARGDLLTLGCAVTFAAHIVMIGHYSQLYGFESLAVVQIATAAVLGSAFFRFAEPVRFHPNAGMWAAVVVTGLFATALAFTTQAWAQQYTSPTRAALIFTLEPVVAWATSYALTGERLAIRGKVGAGMILAGILLAEVRPGGKKCPAD